MDNIERICRVVDYIENNLKEPIDWKEAAANAYISPYHFHRIFSAVVGDTITDYIRKRRLTHAAKMLLSTDYRIIDIACEYGFSSHEAFTRAFKTCFFMSPKEFRNKATLNFVDEFKALSREAISHIHSNLSLEPEIVEVPTFHVVGMSVHTNLIDTKIPELWERFIPRMHEIDSPDENTAYNISICDPAFQMEYVTSETIFHIIAAMKVEKPYNIPKEMEAHTVSGGKYAVFTHKGELEKLEYTYNYIFGTWFTHTKYNLRNGDDFGLYNEDFHLEDPDNSTVYIYIPIED